MCLLLWRDKLLVLTQSLMINVVIFRFLDLMWIQSIQYNSLTTLVYLTRAFFLPFVLMYQSSVVFFTFKDSLHNTVINGKTHSLVLLGYEHVKGQVLDANELKVLFEGLKLNKLHHFSHLLTGINIFYKLCWQKSHNLE